MAFAFVPIDPFAAFAFALTFAFAFVVYSYSIEAPQYVCMLFQFSFVAFTFAYRMPFIRLIWNLSCTLTGGGVTCNICAL